MTDDTAPTYQFRWARCWKEPARSGGLHAFAETRAFDRAEKIAEARAAHAEDSKGGWVRPGMIEPHVTPLQTFTRGRYGFEELAPGRDLDPAAEQMAVV